MPNLYVLYEKNEHSLDSVYIPCLRCIFLPFPFCQTVTRQGSGWGDKADGTGLAGRSGRTGRIEQGRDRAGRTGQKRQERAERAEHVWQDRVGRTGQAGQNR